MVMQKTVRDGKRPPASLPILGDATMFPLAKELIKSDRKAEDFITLLNFMDPKEATDFAYCLHKCQIHKLDKQADLFWTIAKARVAIKENRAKMFSQTIIGVAVPEFFGGKDHDRNKE